MNLIERIKHSKKELDKFIIKKSRDDERFLNAIESFELAEKTKVGLSDARSRLEFAKNIQNNSRMRVEKR